MVASSCCSCWYFCEGNCPSNLPCLKGAGELTHLQVMHIQYCSDVLQRWAFGPSLRLCVWRIALLGACLKGLCETQLPEKNYFFCKCDSWAIPDIVYDVRSTPHWASLFSTMAMKFTTLGRFWLECLCLVVAPFPYCSLANARKTRIYAIDLFDWYVSIASNRLLVFGNGLGCERDV